ncbi:MAG TPA: prephenate dehydratase [Alphaproteobacteria bacterium]|nr:prephenate dehydratase [Alphaproteobacteria bacterium]
MTKAAGPIAFQGLHGAYADLAARAIFPGLATLPCPTFEAVFVAVREGKADRGVIPVENSLYGRIADIHHLLPGGGLKIVGECYQPIHHCLLGVKGAKLEQVREALSQEPALGQVAKTLRRLGLKPVARTDTAGSAAEVAATGDPSKAAVASLLAAEIHGLDILVRNIQDEEHNTTRFLVMARESVSVPPEAPIAVVGFAFEVRNIPAALYKVLGGFATNGINMTKLESYMVGGSFAATQFYAEVEGRIDDPAMERAFEELKFFARSFDILGAFAGDPERRKGK